MSSRERLDMENKNSTAVSFKQKKGYFLQRWILVTVVAAAALCLIIVGLLVGYLAPCRESCLRNAKDSNLDDDDELLKPKKYPYVLLPKSIVPEHYDVELQPFLTPGNFTFKGDVKILLKVLMATDNVTLHANDLKIRKSSVKLTSVLGDPVPNLEKVSTDDVREFYVLHLDSNLQPGHRYEVSMSYVGNLNDQLAGFYRSSYKDKDGNTRWLATTQFQPTDARRAFPCFDEPALKATFNITIVHWSNMTSLSNMPIYKTEERGQGWIADYFEATVRMSTYLLAFIVSDFKGNGTPKFSVWSREDALDTTNYALEIGPKILTFYEEFFGVPYPLPKTDMVAIPDFNAGAMENWGLVTYRETALLHDPRFASAANKERIATVVSHELAHQWFGNLVTPKWWDDLWLNEGFASYVEYLGVNSIHPEWMMDQQFVVEELQSVMTLDCLKTSHPISVPVSHPDEINEIFDRISYAKGATIIRMMKYFLGDQAFQKGLANYLDAMKFDNAVQDDLWTFLTKAQDKQPHIDVKIVMDSWTLQMGFPVLTITRDYSNGKAKITQSRFLLDQSSKGSDDKKSYLWEIPLTYTDQRNPNWDPETKLWLHKTNGTLENLPGSEHWIIANIQEVGYYKVNYDIENWKKLVSQLDNDHKQIHTINRAQILDDSMDLARAGLLDYGLALNVTRYLNNEREYLPWKSALSSLSYIDSMLSRSAIYGKWKKYMEKKLQPIYDWLGWDEDSSENILRQYLRSITLSWLCANGHKDCVKMATQLFQKWQQDTSVYTTISPNLRLVVYCTAIQNGDESTWDFLWKEYTKATVASEKDKFMYALSCTREPWLLTRYLNWSLNATSGIRKQDGSFIFRYTGGKLYGRDLTFNYIRDKWNKIIATYGKSTFGINGMLKSVTYSLNTQFELYQLKEFYKKNKDNLGTARRAFQQSMENVEANVRWMDNNYEHIAKWLELVEGQ